LGGWRVPWLLWLELGGVVVEVVVVIVVDMERTGGEPFRLAGARSAGELEREVAELGEDEDFLERRNREEM
jgi:hypothetical protein